MRGRVAAQCYIGQLGSVPALPKRACLIGPPKRREIEDPFVSNDDSREFDLNPWKLQSVGFDETLGQTLIVKPNVEIPHGNSKGIGGVNL